MALKTTKSTLWCLMLTIGNSLKRYKINKGVRHKQKIISIFLQAIMSLPESHKGGKLCAYKLICKMSLLRNQDIPVEQDHLSQLFYVIHEGLNSNDQV